MYAQSERPAHTELDYLTVTQTAARLGVSDRAVLKWIKQGYFPGTIRISPTGPYRIPIVAVEQYEQNRRVS